MIAGIKYCGGCNPEYNRGEVVKKLKDELAHKISFEVADINKDYDVILVVSGCRRCCAEYLNLRSRNGCIFIAGETDYPKIYALLNQLADK